MNILKRIKINKLYSFNAVSLVVILSLIAYYLIILLPEQKSNDQEVSKLKDEVVKLQLQLIEKEAIFDDKKIFSDCDKEAETKARELLAKKIDLSKATGDYNLKEYQKAYDLGLRLKDDYNSYYENCLRRFGVKY